MTNLSPGIRVVHPDFGEGIVVSIATNNFIRVFFSGGEKQVPFSSLKPLLTRTEQILSNVDDGLERGKKAWLTYQAYALPLMESASSLTAAKIDLLPHQVVLTHSISTAWPRRFMIADEVGLGKTIETALILRELASRGELTRALMVVPAGLVNNWHRELNEVFNLDFEVFGREGDVSDRRSNAFEKHDRLIASIDTLKKSMRIKHLKEAPMWDLVVFDEAHHLTAYRSGGKVKKTENFKLAEMLKSHTRDLLLLSATPHQGDHFRFWMLIQLLNPTLFSSPEDMLENRHRLNSVVYRRTKADACRADGSNLFSRRWVHTESFIMSQEERTFYNALSEYLADGFDLAKRQGSKGRSLGFIMTVFQKIAASSFAAVSRTLLRRLIVLTIKEGIINDENLEIDLRDAAYLEARELIRMEFGLGQGLMADFEVERLLAEYKRRLLKQLDEESMALLSAENSNEKLDSSLEEVAFSSANVDLPEERSRIKYLLSKLPKTLETKVQKLLLALSSLWRFNQNEKIVIFTTYLGSVEIIASEIENHYPGQGVAVLKGGDHGIKIAAEKRFRSKDGPKVLICTAAGREGINLQFARILFNFDLPWNPMDVEQRIGRIHRYGQHDTAQIYNLVLSDTIEGKIFLMLDAKLRQIARTLGKIDEHGNIAEDLRSQILGQLSERLSYERLYTDALLDPELKRTKVELDAAMSNASEARKVVFELFQDLDRFSLDEFKPLSNVEKGIERIMDFIKTALEIDNKKVLELEYGIYQVVSSNGSPELRFTTDRERSIEVENVDLIGLDHPIVQKYITKYRELSPGEVGIRVRSADYQTGVLSLWFIEVTGERRENKYCIVPIAIDSINNQRLVSWEKQVDYIYKLPPNSVYKPCSNEIVEGILESMLQRELLQRGLLGVEQGYTATLVGWVEVT